MIHKDDYRPKENSSREKWIAKSLAILAGIALFTSVAHTSSSHTHENELVLVDNPPTWQTLDFDYNPSIIQLDPPLINPEGDRKVAVKGIVIHWWGSNGEGGIQPLVKALRGNKTCGPTGCSVQYGITNDGDTYRMMSHGNDFAYQAGNVNSMTVGIEIEGESKDFLLDSNSFNPKKFAAAVSLANKIVTDFGLEVEGSAACNNPIGIHGHYEFNACTSPESDKKDPSPEYLHAIIESVKKMQQNK